MAPWGPPEVLGKLRASQISSAATVTFKHDELRLLLVVHMHSGVCYRVTPWEIFPKKTTSGNDPQMFPGPVGADLGLTRPVEMQPSRRETL